MKNRRNALKRAMLLGKIGRKTENVQNRGFIQDKLVGEKG